MSGKHAHLFSSLADAGELTRAWLDVMAHYPKGRLPPALSAFDRRRAAGIESLAIRLREREFLPSPAALIFIPKANHPDEQRPIALVETEDRIVLTALNRLLVPLFDRQFLPQCYAYRKGRSAWAAVQYVSQRLREGLVQVALGDIDSFFSNIDRTQVLEQVSRTIYERPVLELLEAYLHIGTARNFEWSDSGRGLAQGSPLSPLLSNLALHDFDLYTQSLGIGWVRYADNIILLAREAPIVEAAFQRIEAFLQENCGLHLNVPGGVLASASSGFEFLGFYFQAGRCTISPGKLNEKRLRVAEILRRNAASIKTAVQDLSETAEGWRTYYGKSADTREQLILLEQHMADLMQPWLLNIRSAVPGSRLSSAEIKGLLSGLVLPATSDPRKKLKWVDLLVARARPRRGNALSNLSQAARFAVEKRKQEYRKRKEERQEVIVSKPGTYLGRSGERLVVRHDGKREMELPLSMVRNITLLTKAVSLSGDFMAEASSRGINIVLSGSDGRPLVRIGGQLLAQYELTLAQSTLAAGPAGLELARTIVMGKIRNQQNLLRYYLKYPERRSGGDFLSVANAAIKEMETVRSSVGERRFGADLELERGRLFAAEAQAAASYWGAVRCLLWWKPGFERRERRGAGDLVNSLLNYGYGILYSRLMNALSLAGLNPYVGVLHKPQRGKAGLLYDFIEEFRAAVVDRTVFGWLNLGIKAEITADGLGLQTRRVLARRILERLQADTRYHGESQPLERVVADQARLLVRHFEGTERYKTYVLPW